MWMWENVYSTATTSSVKWTKWYVQQTYNRIPLEMINQNYENASICRHLCMENGDYKLVKKMEFITPNEQKLGLCHLASDREQWN